MADYIEQNDEFALWRDAVLDGLEAMYPDAAPQLHFGNAYELLIATILSAQCTDKQVNRTTPALFAAFPNAATMVNAEQTDVEELIRTCGFYHNKAANIIHACKDIAEKHGGEVPSDREELQSLAGVGRKTASVVLSNAFGIPAIAVDTHVFRVSNRIGLANATTVEATEKQLMEVIPQNKWSIAHHWLIFHGRRVCSARKPRCEECAICDLCKNKPLTVGHEAR